MKYKKCIVCGRNIDDKYTFCLECNRQKTQGIITKCEVCGRWHYKNAPCPFLYDPKCVISDCENDYYRILKKVVPENYCIFPQVNLAAFVERKDNSKYINELFRNVDFLITDLKYIPKLVIEINDSSHEREDRQERDRKVKNILEEAGIPLLTLWVKDGINEQNISLRLNELLHQPIERVRHPQEKCVNHNQQPSFSEEQPNISQQTPSVIAQPNISVQKKEGCYIATCVYGSYDCPSVWTLRRFRDEVLRTNFLGRLLIQFYYAVSPALVKWFGNKRLFRYFWKNSLDKLVMYLNKKGIDDKAYEDKS